MTAELEVSATIAAPAERVWRAMTERRHIPHWWGPYGCTATVQDLDLRPGGAFNYVMNGPGLSLRTRAVFSEVTPPERLVFAGGDAVTTLILSNEGSGTRVTIRLGFASAFNRDQFARAAGNAGQQTLQRLAAYLPGMSD